MPRTTDLENGTLCDWIWAAGIQRKQWESQREELVELLEKGDAGENEPSDQECNTVGKKNGKEETENEGKALKIWLDGEGFEKQRGS